MRYLIYGNIINLKHCIFEDKSYRIKYSMPTWIIVWKLN